MSKPSSTNYPNTSYQIFYIVFVFLISLFTIYFCIAFSSFVFIDKDIELLRAALQRSHLGGYSFGAPPLPIPNREVKPVSADGTAIPSGRVGSRQLLLKAR